MIPALCNARCLSFASSGYPRMADIPSVLLLASAASAAGGNRKEEDPGGQQRADRWADPGDVAPLVCGGRGGCKGKKYFVDVFRFCCKIVQYVLALSEKYDNMEGCGGS